MYRWNVSAPESADGQTPPFPFTSPAARLFTALALSLMIGFFTVLFVLSIQLGQASNLICTALCVFLFIFILLVQCVRTKRMCRNLVLPHPWFLHSLSVSASVLCLQALWLSQGSFIYSLPADFSSWQTFVPLGIFSNEASQVSLCLLCSAVAVALAKCCLCVQLSLIHCAARLVCFKPRNIRHHLFSLWMQLPREHARGAVSRRPTHCHPKLLRHLVAGSFIVNAGDSLHSG